MVSALGVLQENAGGVGGVRPWDGVILSQCLLLAGPGTRTTRKGGCPCRNSPCPCEGYRTLMFLILCLIPQWGLGSLLPLMGDTVPLSPMGGSRKVLDSGEQERQAWGAETGQEVGSERGRPQGCGGKTLVNGGLACVWCPHLWWDRFGDVTLNQHISEDSSATPEKLPVLSPGSMMHLEASVHFSPSISMKIQVDQCYGTNMEQPGHSRRLFMVMNSRGSVLVGQELGAPSPATLGSCRTS